MTANTASFSRLPGWEIADGDWDKPLPLFCEAAGAFSNKMKYAVLFLYTPCAFTSRQENLLSLVWS